MNRPALLIRNASRTDFGGGERIPVFIAKELRTLGLDVIVVSRSSKLLAFAQENKVPTLRGWWWAHQNWSGVKNFLIPLYFLWQIVLLFYYLVLFIKVRPSSIHLQSKDDFIAGTAAAKILHINCFWSDYADLKHIWLNNNVWYKNPIGKLVYASAHLTRSIVVVSAEDRRVIQSLIPHGSVSRKIRVIHNGVFDEYETASKSISFISTSRLVRDKGIGELIEAFSKLIAIHPKATLAVIGDGPEATYFKNKAKGMKGIKFYGHVSNPIPYLAKSDTFILPTYHEGFSIALVEASMQGLSIIATDVGGNPEIISNNNNGLLVPSMDVASLANAMQTLYESKEKREKLGRNARKTFLSSYDFKKIVKDKFLPLYKGLE